MMRNSGRAAQPRVVTRLLTAAVGVVALIGVSDVGPAYATEAADLSISQGFETATTPGTVVDDVYLINSGPSTANNVDVIMLIQTKSTTFSALASNGACQSTTAPPGYQYAVDCRYGAIASLGEVDYKITYSGDSGAKFRSVLITAASSPSDPNLNNDMSWTYSYFGPAADMSIAQHATTGGVGKAKVVAIATNNGPDVTGRVVIVSELRGQNLKPVKTTPGPGGSCVHVLPSPTYNRAFSCSIPALAVGASFSVTSRLRGKPGTRVKVPAGTAAETPAEPDNSNNRVVVRPKLGKKPHH